MAQVILAILGISFLMIIHEAGHYVMARAAGMRVLTFSIGFGPTLYKFRPKGSATTFQIGLIPLLAYVRIAGATPLEENDPNDKGLYMSKSASARALTLLGGPVANYLFASIVIFILALTGWREEVPSSPMVVAEVQVGSPAALAGLRPGDVVLEVENKPIHDVAEMGELTRARAGKPTHYLVQRDGNRLDVTITPREANGRGVVGVSTKVETRSRRLGIAEAGTLAVALPYAMTKQSVEGITDLIKHRTTEGVTGPVGMTKQVASQAKKDAYSFFAILVAISIGLGCFNLLPFPFLDGGRLLFVLFEVLAGRRPNQNVETLIHAAGMLLLLGMAAFVTWRDLT